MPEGTEIGDELEVFVYLDQDERPIATTGGTFGAGMATSLTWSVHG